MINNFSDLSSKEKFPTDSLSISHSSLIGEYAEIARMAIKNANTYLCESGFLFTWSNQNKIQKTNCISRL